MGAFPLQRSPVLGRMLALVVLCGAVDATAAGVDPDGLGLHHAWSENTGWIDALPDGQPAAALTLQDGLLSGWLWSSNAGWISAGCGNTESCTDVDYRLRLETDPDAPGFLRLVGMAWSENAGWIVAHCATTDTCTQVDYGLQVHAATGVVEGFAWSENLGWLSFSCADTGSCATLDFGLQFDAAELSRPDLIFRNGFEG